MDLPPYRNFFKITKFCGYLIGLNPIKHTNENVKYAWILDIFGAFLTLNHAFTLVNIGLSFVLANYTFLEIVSTISVFCYCSDALFKFIFAWRNCDKISGIVNDLEELYQIQWKWHEEVVTELLEHQKKMKRYQYLFVPIHIMFAYFPVFITVIAYLFMDDPEPRFPLTNYYFYDKFQHVLLTFFIELNQTRYGVLSILVADCTLILIIIQLVYQFESLGNGITDIVKMKSVDKSLEDENMEIGPSMRIGTLEQAFKLHLKLLE